MSSCFRTLFIPHHLLDIKPPRGRCGSFNEKAVWQYAACTHLNPCTPFQTRGSRSTSPQPSPSGRGGSRVRCSHIHTTSDSTTDCRPFCPSLRERTCVKGKSA